MAMKANLLFMSTSAFLQTMLANRLPIPLIEGFGELMRLTAPRLKPQSIRKSCIHCISNPI
ncbi:hypothetical protein CR513_45792, partial [Mucuna pruriens]